MKHDIRTKTLTALSTMLIATAADAYGAAQQSGKTELAKQACVTTASVESDSNPASTVNDNAFRPSSPYWSSFTSAADYGSEAYVELQWEASNQIVECRVYWAQDGEHVEYPTEAWIEIQDGKEWVRAAELNPADALQDGLSKTTGLDITASRIRLCMKGTKACGIHEIRLFGYKINDPAEAYRWPGYSPTLDYDYRSEYPALDAPTRFLPEDNNQKGYMADGWWAIAWGPKTSSYVTETAKKGILKKMNEDFAYFRDEMGWPPDKRARNGYYSTIYVYGSGLYSDDADSTATGGWQAATWYRNSTWPMVNISYYPIACFDPAFTYDKYHNAAVGDQTFQQNACVHEGIHAIFADLEGCKESAWYQEAGNTWLQAEAEVIKSGKTPESMGYLSAGNMIAPFLPIECYSGWLLDGSFGGPSAEGVNMFNSTGQVCTWRNLLGGVQYGELFPHFVSEILGRGSIAWIWRNCKGRVLEGMASRLGDRQMRRMIREYRVRQAMIDVGMWSNACRKLIDDNWLVSIKQERAPYSQSVKEWKATPYSNMYADTELGEGWYYPEQRTTPGWSGANQIPLHVSGNEGDVISLYFKPLGENMVCQLAYRAERTGQIYYSQPIEEEGEISMQLAKKPANGVVIAVVCNTDYIYKGDVTRKTHYDYRLKMGQNVYQPAKAQLKWYNYRASIKDNTFTAIEDVKADTQSTEFDICLDRNAVRAGEELGITVKAAGTLQIPVVVSDMAGRKLCSKSFLRDGSITIPATATPGIYIITAYNAHGNASKKFVIK